MTPRDSVYVDADRRDHARAVVDRYLEEIREEMAWATLVAGFDDPAQDEVPRWPASEDVPPDVDPTSTPTRTRRPAGGCCDRPRPRSASRSCATWSARWRARTPRTTSSRRPRRRSRCPTRSAGRPGPALLGGPLFLIIATIFDLDVSGWAGLLALGAFVGGFVTLVARMEDRPPNDLGGDDGAVV